MSLDPAAFHVVLLSFSATITAVLAAYAFANRREPGAIQFAVLMAAVTVWTGAFAAGLVTIHPRWRVFWASARWIGAAFVPVGVLVFGLAYTGHDELLTSRNVGMLSVFPLVTVAMVWTNAYHHLVWVDHRVVVHDGIALLEVTFGPWFWAYMVYAWVLTVVGSALLLRLVFVSDYLYADQSALLLVAVAAPLAGNAASVFLEQPFPGIDLAPYGFTITGLALGYALFSRRLLDLVPATRRLGRNAAIGQLDDGVVIVDREYRVIYLNATAADVLGCDPGDAIGEPVRSFVDESALDFHAAEALADWEREDGTYSVRTSPIHDQHDRPIGHTVVVQDITGRKRRERELARQRDELARVNELNAVIRGVNRALVSATSREDIAEAVCSRLADSELYEAALAADVPTWNGDADRWTVAGEATPAALPAGLDGEEFPVETGRDGIEAGAGAVVATAAGQEGGWTVVPLVYGRTVYGALALFSRREPLTDGGRLPERERDVLAELGELIGHAVNAVENRRLLSAAAVVELEFHSGDGDDPLLAAARETGATLAVTGLVPDGGATHLAYVAVEDADPDAVADALSSASASDVDVAGAAGAPLLEWRVSASTLVGTLVDHGANVLEAAADGDGLDCVVEVPSDTDVRALVDRLTGTFPDTRLEAKRERSRPAERADAVPEERIEDLTDRQREALEVAYRAGYFDWPRESTAEEVAASMDIASPTFHYHLRRSEATILAGLFESDATRD